MIFDRYTYNALPSHDAVLPSGQTVGAWVAERIARSRVPAGGAR